MKIWTYQLDDEFIKHFWITKVVECFEWAQKLVFIVEIDKNLQVIKLFKNFWRRDDREINIYDKYKSLAGIPKIIKVDTYDDNKIVFEEFIDWQSLEKILWNYKSQTNKIKELLLGIIDILKPFWQDNIVHRDLKPSNIIIDSNNKPFVIDFWIARDLNDQSLTDTWFQPLTYRFASPEQFAWNKKLIWYRTDFFSLWIIAYLLYYWELPFGNDVEKIKEMYEKWAIEYVTIEKCCLNKFFEWTLKTDPSSRPRNHEMLISLLS